MRNLVVNAIPIGDKVLLSFHEDGLSSVTVIMTHCSELCIQTGK
jgi:hypothetical protein